MLPINDRKAIDFYRDLMNPHSSLSEEQSELERKYQMGNLTTIQAKSAEIDRLKAELELRTKERDQAIDVAGLEPLAGGLVRSNRCGIHFSPKTPELYAHLAGRGGVMFKLQVGDVTDLKGEVVALEEDGRVYLFDNGQRMTHSHFFQLRDCIVGKVHRPTPEGLVQVWPEVKG